MNTASRALLVCLLPLAWLAAMALALLLVLLDALCWPFVLLRRRQPPDVAPGTRNASIVVLNWNGLHFLRELMPSLHVAVQRCPGDHEVIVVDNGSDDGSAEWLAAEQPWARVVRLPENRFFIRGNAAGAAVASRELLVFLNNDMRVEPDFLVELLRPFGPPGAGPGDLFAVSARIEMAGHRSETGLTRCFVKHGELRFVQIPGATREPVPVLWAGGGSSAFDRAKYDAIGGFEALYEPCYVEDVSLSWQAWRRGWRAVYAHDSVVHHAHRGTSSKVFGRERLERLNWRNRELFFVRSVTDPALLLTHALMLPWNLHKRSHQLGLTLAHGVAAVLATLPRLPHAIWQRERSRPDYRRSDRALLAQVPVPSEQALRAARRPAFRDVQPHLRFVAAARDDYDLGLFPDFLIIGPQRTGTTWLASHLGNHPQVFVPPEKELYYFNNLRHHGQHHRQELGPVQQELGWYLAFFRPDDAYRTRRDRECQRTFGRPYEPMLRGEATASYAAGVDREVVAEILRFNPDLKVLMMVRDPIERAWSHVKKDFEREGRTLADAEDDELIRYFSTDYLRRCGLYSEIHGTWSSLVPAPNFFVGRFADLRDRPRDLLLDVFAFLGIDADPRFTRDAVGERINATEDVPMPPAVRQCLDAMFAAEQESLRAHGLL